MKWKSESVQIAHGYIEPVVISARAYASLRKALKKSAVEWNLDDYIMLKDGTIFEPIDRQLNIEGGR